MSVQRVLYGEAGQSLRYIPSERVASATYAIEDLEYDAEDPGRIVASGSATVDSLSLTTDAAAGDGEIDQAKVPVTSTTGASVGQTAVIVASDGSFELFEVSAVETDDYLRARHPLVGLYASGSSVLGVQLTAPVPSSVYDEEEYVEMEEGLRVVWEFTTGGVLRKHQQQIRVVYQAEADVGLGFVEAKIRNAYPDIVDRVNNSQEISGWIGAAKDEIYARFRARNMRPEQYMFGDAMHIAVMYLAMRYAAENGVTPRGQDANEFREQMHMNYSAHINRYLNGRMGADTADLDPISNSFPGGRNARGSHGPFRRW